MASIVAAQDPAAEETFDPSLATIKLFEGSVLQVISASQPRSRKLLRAADPDTRLLVASQPDAVTSVRVPFAWCIICNHYVASMYTPSPHSDDVDLMLAVLPS